MRPIISVIILAICLTPVWSGAATRAAGTERPANEGAASRARLDELFASLKAAKSEGEGRTIEADIWQFWSKSGRADVDRLMKKARLLAGRGRLESALGLLDNVVFAAPDYVEGWNRRATVLFNLARDEASLADIAKVLTLEPRHFGALAGKALIHLRAEKWQDALTALHRAVEVHPYLRERHFIPDLERKLNIRKL